MAAELAGRSSLDGGHGGNTGGGTGTGTGSSHSSFSSLGSGAPRRGPMTARESPRPPRAPDGSPRPRLSDAAQTPPTARTARTPRSVTTPLSGGGPFRASPLSASPLGRRSLPGTPTPGRTRSLMDADHDELIERRRSLLDSARRRRVSAHMGSMQSLSPGVGGPGHPSPDADGRPSAPPPPLTASASAPTPPLPGSIRGGPATASTASLNRSSGTQNASGGRRHETTPQDDARRSALSLSLSRSAEALAGRVPLASGGHASLAPLGAHRRISSSASLTGSQTLGMLSEETQKTLENLLKFITENKLNAQNSWDTDLIGTFYKSTVSDTSPANINFQRASRALEGCVKVYTSRVDSLDGETKTLLTGLFSRRGDGADDGDGDGEKGDGARGAGDGLGGDGGGAGGAFPAKRARKRAQRTTTLEADPAALEIRKVDSEFSVDPLFRKTCADFDEAGSRGLLLNTLDVTPLGQLIMDAGDVTLSLATPPVREMPAEVSIDATFNPMATIMEQDDPHREGGADGDHAEADAEAEPAADGAEAGTDTDEAPMPALPASALRPLDLTSFFMTFGTALQTSFAMEICPTLSQFGLGGQRADGGATSDAAPTPAHWLAIATQHSERQMQQHQQQQQQLELHKHKQGSGLMPLFSLMTLDDDEDDGDDDANGMAIDGVDDDVGGTEPPMLLDDDGGDGFPSEDVLGVSADAAEGMAHVPGLSGDPTRSAAAAAAAASGGGGAAGNGGAHWPMAGGHDRRTPWSASAPLTAAAMPPNVHVNVDSVFSYFNQVNQTHSWRSKLLKPTMMSGNGGNGGTGSSGPTKTDSQDGPADGTTAKKSKAPRPGGLRFVDAPLVQQSVLFAKSAASLLHKPSQLHVPAEQIVQPSLTYDVKQLFNLALKPETSFLNALIADIHGHPRDGALGGGDESGDGVDDGSADDGSLSLGGYGDSLDDDGDDNAGAIYLGASMDVLPFSRSSHAATESELGGTPLPGSRLGSATSLHSVQSSRLLTGSMGPRGLSALGGLGGLSIVTPARLPNGMTYHPLDPHAAIKPVTRRDGLNYTRKAKRVNVHLLKDNLWNELTHLATKDAVLQARRAGSSDAALSHLPPAAAADAPAADGPTNDHDGSPAALAAAATASAATLDSADGASTTAASEPDAAAAAATSSAPAEPPQLLFSKTVQQLSRRYSEREYSDISPAFCFICLLHLANEKGLEIKNEGPALQDLGINRVPVDAKRLAAATAGPASAAARAPAPPAPTASSSSAALLKRRN
ncbi:hypothetical protein CXG81DRAFT_25763 [Caulochytrium protostelioides]|uniref:Condensin complex subunit 2 n=1 Tax=Caulochytrium protostelioides TaxID=1555241 RepID=A0A4P9X979_9FUNG|nr:hypothetical protein CXG81DRAFT_25763 [Caulochytrium protostelioides]|eukprot:RKP01551.1 hypothetical protein CXG81DRAFT_25763 [Caulochytrium protostelioides]